MSDPPTLPEALWFGALAKRWQIKHDPGLHVWTAVRQYEGSSKIRVIVGRTIDDLRAKLKAAEEAEES